MYSTHQKGAIAQLKAELRAIEKGFVVSRPTVEARYDLVIDDGRKLNKVQVKYASTKKFLHSVDVNLRSECRNNGYSKLYTREEIDLILVYVPKIEKILCFNSDMFHKRKSICVRFENAKNNQQKRIIFAKNLVW